MKNWLMKYFAFTKREYNGLLALMAILLLISIFPSIYEHYLPKASGITPEERSAIVKLTLVSQESTNSGAYLNPIRPQSGSKMTTRLFSFDPNTLSLTGWQELGLSQKQAQVIVNYSAKGGKFFQPSDLQKMYTITPEKFKQLEPYIKIDKDVLIQKKIYPATPTQLKKEPIVIEVNSADTLQLDQIKGIGATFARRIATYRTRLGGFYDKGQLMEVFGIDSVKYNEIKDQVRIDPTYIQKININIAEFESLKRHPYLSYKQINAIIQYRKQHGNFKSIDDLKKVVILTPQNIQKLAPYLTF